MEKKPENMSKSQKPEHQGKTGAQPVQQGKAQPYGAPKQAAAKPQSTSGPAKGTQKV